jgi:hypothetical protein
MVQATNVYGETYNYDAQTAREVTQQAERDKLYLEAAQTGDYSKITSKGASGQERSEIESRANLILRKYNAIQGQQANDYSAAAEGTPVLYPGHSFERVFGEGKGYAVYDSFKTDDGTQYLAVSGKNSSWVEKVNPDGTRERVMRTRGDENDGRGSNIGFAKRALADVKESLLTVDTGTDDDDTTVTSDMENQFNTLMASFDHYMATGEDDGGGYIDPATGLPPGVSNEAEAFLLRSGNYNNAQLLGQADMLGILNGASDDLKQQLYRQYGVAGDTMDEAISKAAVSMNYGAIGAIGDSRDLGRLFALTRLGSDAFIQGLNIATRQNWEAGVVQNDEDGNPIGYAAQTALTFGMENGQPMFYGAGGVKGGLTSAKMGSIWFSPEEIQSITQGDVYTNYNTYYENFRKQYEFMTDTNFLRYKDFKPVVKPITTTTTGTGTGTTGTGTTGGGSDTGVDTTITYDTGTGDTAVDYGTQEVTQTFDTTQPQLGGPGTGTYPQAAVTGTFNTPTQTAGLSAVPTSVTTKTGYTGTNLANLTQQSQQGFGGQQTYSNAFGQQVTVTEDASGNPITYVPPGFTKAAKGGLMRNHYAEGGDTGSRENEALYTIAKMNGYNGPKTGTALKAFFNSSDALKAKARAIGVAMNKGGAVLYADDGVDVQPGTTLDPTFTQNLAGMTQGLIGQTMQPVQAPVQYVQPQAEDFISGAAGQAYAVAPFAQAATIPSTSQAGMPMTADAATMTPSTVSDQVQAETAATQAAQGQLSPQAQVTAQQQLTTSVAGTEAAQGTATMVNAPAAREIQQGEIISGVADAEKAAQFNEQIQAATATPTKQATVAGQLEGLMQQFEGGATPAWAAGSMRTAMQTLAARGLGASSLAGQAVIQAAMEAALPIAQMDAQTTAQFEAQNLSNRQQRAMLAAQQRATFLGQEFDQAFQARVQNSARIGDIANMNFTAEQNIALENSRAANTVNLQNLSNRQAVVMAEASALANLDMANLNNRQQAAVQNAQSFLQMDMTNLNNEQQTAIFKAQQNIQALFTDQAAENAALQFNATSENQTNQFFASLTSQVSQFNATQQNAMDQFNVNSVNALREFNSELQQQRDLFNAQNGLVVAQANAQWRQNIATMNTAAQNESNMNFAKTMNALTSTNLDAYWQRERDIMSFAFTSAENAADRMASVLLEKLSAENKANLADEMGKGALGATLLKGALNYMAGSTIV